MPLIKNDGSAGMSYVTKPRHSDRVRLQLPAISPTKRRERTLAPIQTQFLAQLDARSSPLGKLKLHPLKILSPYQKKLTTLEAQRIIGVLDELKVKCEIILILPYVMKNLSTYKEMLGPQLTSMVTEHSLLLEEFYGLEKTYLEVCDTKQFDQLNSSINIKVEHGSNTSTVITQSTDTTINLPITSADHRKLRESAISLLLPSDSRSRIASDGSYRGMQPTRNSVEQDTRVHRLNKIKTHTGFSIKNILRAFRNDEKVTQELLAEAGGRKYKEATYFLQCLAELREMLLARLLVTPTEQHEKMQILAQIAAQERNNQAVIDKLEADLALAVEDRDKEVLKKNDIIRNLQSNLEMLEKATDDDIRRAKTECEKQTLTENRASQLRKQSLSAELKALTSQLNIHTGENRDEEQRLRMKKFKLESEVENWIQKFDEQMTRKQNEYEKIDAVYKEEKKQLAKLEERFKVIDDEYKEIMRRRELEKEAKAERVRTLQRQVHSVIAIQALYRSFRVRQMLKAKEKQKVKGMKKKKKKKKKGRK